MNEYNKPQSEYGGVADESGKVRENQSYSLNPPHVDNPTYPAINEGSGVKTSKAADKGKKASAIIANFTTAAVAVAAIGVGLTPIADKLTPTAQVEIRMVDMQTTSSALFYELEITGDGALTLVLTNNSTTTREEALEQGVNDGSFENLVNGMSYTLSVVSEGALGDNTLASWDVKLKPHPIESVSASITGVGVDGQTVSYTASVTGSEPLEIVLEGNGYSQSQPLSSGGSEGSFGGVPYDGAYTLSIVGGSVGGRRVFDSRSVSVDKHPIENASASITGATVDLNTLTYTVDWQSEVPLTARLEGNGKSFESAVTDGGVSGAFEGAFEGLDWNSPYTLSIVGMGPQGEKVLASTAVLVDEHPIYRATASIYNEMVVETTAYFTVEVQSEVPLRVVTSGTGFYEISELTDGVNGCWNSGLEYNSTYYIDVVGDGPDGEVIVASSTVRVPEKIEPSNENLSVTLQLKYQPYLGDLDELIYEIVVTGADAPNSVRLQAMLEPHLDGLTNPQPIELRQDVYLFGDGSFGNLPDGEYVVYILDDNGNYYAEQSITVGNATPSPTPTPTP